MTQEQPKGGGQKGGTQKQPCPQCGKPSSGNFCQHCGAALGGRFCNQCGAKISGAAKFCTQCGAPVGGGAQVPAAGNRGAPGGHRAAAAATLGGGNAPWWIAGVAMFGLILVVGWSMVSRAGPTAPAGGAPAGMPGGGNPAAGQSTIDLNAMTPREAADRLFNRVMESVSAGDTTNALFFQPMAVQAYERAEPLDLDGLLHEALLELLTDPTAALATTQRILDSEPDHVLGLGTAARAAEAMGDSAKAADYYQHLLRVYDQQYARNLVEYDGHRALMAEMKDEAQRYLSSR
jgi:hypothetical protein